MYLKLNISAQIVTKKLLSCITITIFNQKYEKIFLFLMTKVLKLQILKSRLFIYIREVFENFSAT